jgi:hypothetical protein
MRVWLVILSLFLWVVILLITLENNIPSDGAAYIGFPKTFLEIVHNPMTGEYVKRWNYLGLVLNILVVGLIFLGLSMLQRKIFIKKDTK